MAVMTERFFATLRMTAPLIVILSTTNDLSAQLPGQSFEIIPDTAPASVGDTVSLRFRIRLHERDQPLDSIPQTAGDLPPGIRVLSVGRLTRSATGVYEGTARVAFYRPGRRAVPVFGLPFMRIVEGVSRGTLPSDSAFVDIRPVLPAAGNPPLKDIRELEHRPISSAPVACARRHGTGRWTIPAPAETDTRVFSVAGSCSSGAAPPTPYDVAVDSLDRIEAERWPSKGNVALHYEAIAYTLRQYLEEAHSVGALERTTSELLWALPPYLSREGLRDQCGDVLGDADLVKFAELRPTAADANTFLERARHLLVAWHAASDRVESADAAR